MPLSCVPKLVANRSVSTMSTLNILLGPRLHAGPRPAPHREAETNPGRQPKRGSLPRYSADVKLRPLFDSYLPLPPAPG